LGDICGNCLADQAIDIHLICDHIAYCTCLSKDGKDSPLEVLYNRRGTEIENLE